MGEAIQCQACDQAATVHLTQIANNKIHKVHLCEICAQAKGMTDPDVFSLEELFSPSSNINIEAASGAESLVCKRCGLSAADFRRSGRLGCPSCYEHLKPLVEPLLANMHKSLSHEGKIPHRSLGNLKFSQNLSELEKELNMAVTEERYEEAARCRDEISNLKKTHQVGSEI